MLDPLIKFVSLDQEAADFGFKWDTSEQILKQIRSECDEVANHLEDQNKNKLQEEIGDLLHAVFSLCVFCQLDPQKTFMDSINKFETRFKLVKQLTLKLGLDSLSGKSFKELMTIWDKAKELQSTNTGE